MIIEMLYFDGCPNHAPARKLVERILVDHGIAAEIRDVVIAGAADARERKFVGSPTIRVNGVDIDHSAHAAADFGMICRIYRDGNIWSGLPSPDLIYRALSNASAGAQSSDG
jgi:hypothetical protein